MDITPERIEAGARELRWRYIGDERYAMFIDSRVEWSDIVEAVLSVPEIASALAERDALVAQRDALKAVHDAASRLMAVSVPYEAFRVWHRDGDAEAAEVLEDYKRRRYQLKDALIACFLAASSDQENENDD